MRSTLTGRFALTHVTIQMERSLADCTENHPPWSLLTEKRLQRAERLLEIGDD